MWGCEFWSKGFYVNTVGKHGDENTIQAYVKSQGNEKTYIVSARKLKNINGINTFEHFIKLNVFETN